MSKDPKPVAGQPVIRSRPLTENMKTEMTKVMFEARWGYNHGDDNSGNYKHEVGFGTLAEARSCLAENIPLVILPYERCLEVRDYNYDLVVERYSTNSDCPEIAARVTGKDYEMASQFRNQAEAILQEMGGEITCECKPK